MAALGNLFGGLFQQAYPQWQNQWTTNTYGTASTTATFAAPHFDDLYRGGNAVRETGPESALAWLDRRVAEVCVKL